MSPIRPSARIVLLGLLALVAPEAVAQGRIDVLNSRGEVTPLTDATVLEETLAEVTFRRGAGTRTESRDTDQVVEIAYGRGSPSFEQAREARDRGDVLGAINLFSAAAQDTDPPWVAAHALLELAETHAARGPRYAPEGVAAIDRFLGAYSEHRLLPRALLLKAELAAAAGDSAAADAAVDRVLELASAGRVTPDWGARAHIVRGRILLDTGDAAAAGDAFASAARAVETSRGAVGARTDLLPKLDTAALQARSGTGRALLAGGDLAGARRYFQELLDEAEDDAIRAAALNGLAEADFRDDGRLKEAQLGFARVAVTAAGVAEEHARALYYLGRCAEALDAAGKEPGGRAAARSYYEEVVRLHPGTHWARQAQQALP